MQTDEIAVGPIIPLADWADRRLQELTEETGSARIAALDGMTLMGERGSANNYTINGRISAGLGGSRLMQTRDGGWFALTLLRQEDRELLPALFLDNEIAINDAEAIARAVARHECAELVERGRLLGLPVASADETPASPPIETIALGPHRTRAANHRPLVVDLSAIWAGPLSGHLFWLAGMEVVKVESLSRPDLIRRDDPQTFNLINQGKANAVIDLTEDGGTAALVQLIERADIVIESSRPRALRHLSIDANALVSRIPGLVWLTITGHGAQGEPANWAGIGNDCGVAAGLSRALADVTGEIGYVGDAIADPLTGITAALEGWQAYKAGIAKRIGFSMSAITASALAEERMRAPEQLECDLRAWGNATGKPFPRVPQRPMLAKCREVGADTEKYFATVRPC